MGVSLIPKPSAPLSCFFFIFEISSHHQPTVFRVTVESLWKTGRGNRTQYCLNSSGFGESFIGSFYTQKKREAILEDKQDSTGQEGQVSVSDWSLADDKCQPSSPCAGAAGSSPAIDGLSDLGGFDSSERLSSFRVGGAG